MNDHNTHGYHTPTRMWPADLNVRLCQGGYYIFTGLLVAVAITFFNPPAQAGVDLSRYWAVRTVGLIVAGIGVLFLVTALRGYQGGAVAWATVIVPALLTALEVSSVTIGTLPVTFLLDTAVQVGFFICWIFLIRSKGSNIFQPAHVRP